MGGAFAIACCACWTSDLTMPWWRQKQGLGCLFNHGYGCRGLIGLAMGSAAKAEVVIGGVDGLCGYCFAKLWAWG